MFQSQKNRTLPVLILLIGSLTLLSSCVKNGPEITVPKTEYIIHVPEKVATPQKPAFEAYNPNYGLNEGQNFKRFQRNAVLLKDYSNALKDTVTHYETQIDALLRQKQQLEQEQGSK